MSREELPSNAMHEMSESEAAGSQTSGDECNDSDSDNTETGNECAAQRQQSLPTPPKGTDQGIRLESDNSDNSSGSKGIWQSWLPYWSRGRNGKTVEKCAGNQGGVAAEKCQEAAREEASPTLIPVLGADNVGPDQPTQGRAVVCPGKHPDKASASDLQQDAGEDKAPTIPHTTGNDTEGRVERDSCSKQAGQEPKHPSGSRWFNSLLFRQTSQVSNPRESEPGTGGSDAAAVADVSAVTSGSVAAAEDELEQRHASTTQSASVVVKTQERRRMWSVSSTASSSALVSSRRPDSNALPEQVLDDVNNVHNEGVEQRSDRTRAKAQPSVASRPQFTQDRAAHHVLQTPAQAPPVVSQQTRHDNVVEPMIELPDDDWFFSDGDVDHSPKRLMLQLRYATTHGSEYLWQSLDLARRKMWELVQTTYDFISECMPVSHRKTTQWREGGGNEYGGAPPSSIEIGDDDDNDSRRSNSSKYKPQTPPPDNDPNATETTALLNKHQMPSPRETPVRTPRTLRQVMHLEAKQVNRIVIIGVHGWFPNRFLQYIAGEPTGTSIRFCEKMQKAILEHFSEEHGIELDINSQITLIPLVGEGRIQDRVDLLLCQLVASTDATTGEGEAEGESSTTTGTSTIATGSQEESKNVRALRQADTVLISAHSQGVVVSAHLLDRLIDMQIIDPRKQRVGMLGMAGIHHGPLASLQNSVVVKYIEADAARELFEFMDPASEVSQTYLASLGSIMQRGVRVICVGSWIDEVVPLYSAVFHGISHPNLYRAVYIDGPHYRDDFLTNLIIFALRLRNGGVDDKGLLVHLSNVIVGTLWGSTSGGHSTIYEEKAVYKLALRWLFYSTIVSKPIIISSSLNSPSVIAPIIKTAQSLLFRVSPDLSALRPCGEDGAAESLHIQYRPLNGSDKLNPFYLPWILHSLWCDSSIKGNPVWRRDIEKLIQLYDEWEPTTKAGKDLKYQLEAIRLCI